MNEELTQKLISRYPVLFGGVNKSLRESLMSFGIECRGGWFQILDALCMMIEGGSIMYFNAEQDYPWYVRLWNWIVCKKLGRWDWSIRYGGKFKTPKFEFMQIKEKYGTLRVYLGQPVFDEETLLVMKKFPKSSRRFMDRWQNEVDGAIQLAEDLSSITCEDCGMPGETCQRGIWLATMCPECMTHRKEYEGYVTCREYAARVIDKPETEDDDENNG